MNINKIALSELPINNKGTIVDLHCSLSLKRRLFDLGLIPGTCITPVFRSPFGEPTAFEFRNTIISIRKEDSSHIFVSLEPIRKTKDFL